MEKSFEQIYQTEPETPKTSEQIVNEKVSKIEEKYGKPIEEVVKEREKTLGLISHVVGKDFGMKVKFGKIGDGSFFAPEDQNIPRDKWNTITLDPLILLEFEGADEFISAHEGAHRAITRTYEQTGLKPKEEREKMAEKIGWSGIHNIGLEDPAVNNWAGNLYPRTAELSDKNYDASFKQENVIMSTPIVTQMIQMLGYVPNFVKYASELQRFWHKKSYSNDLPQKVKAALNATQRSASSYWAEIPYTHPTEKDVLQKAKIRWQIYEKGIWPFMQAMIEEDLIDEKLKQYLKDQLQKAMEQMEKNDKEKQGGKQEKQQTGGQGSDGTDLEDLMEQFGFDEKEKQEMKEKIKEAMERKKEQMEKLKERLRNGKISQKGFDKQTQEAEGNMPIDMKSMSESAKKKIEEKLSKESKEKKKEMVEKAKELLQKAEDEANEDIQGKIGPKEESHEARRERQAKEAEEAKKQAKESARQLEKTQKEQKQFEEWQTEQEAKKTAWEKAVSEQAKTIDELHQLFEDLFKKKKHPHWKPGYSAGHRLDLGAAMQYEADPRNYTRLWEKKTIPEKYDYRFTILNDQSGSMREGTKAENDLIAKALVAEVLAGLGIPCEIFGYTTSHENNVKKYKSFDENLNEERERLMKELSKIVSEGGGNTPTYTATQIASESLALQKENTRNHAHFLLVVTDGVPYNDPISSSIEDLKKLNRRLSEENQQVIIGMGIGDGISEENLKAAYGEDKYVYAKNPEEFPKKMAALLEAIFTQSQRIKR